jgi:signal transduction histidine kinase
MRVVLVMLITGLGFMPLVAAETWHKWLSPDLEQAGQRRSAILRELEELGQPMVGQTSAEIGFQASRWRWPPPRPHWVQVDLAESFPIDSVALFPALVHWRSDNRAIYAFPVRFRIDLSDDPEFKTFLPAGNYSGPDMPATGPGPVVIHAGGRRARYVRLTVTELAKEEGKYFFALSELMVLSGNLNVAVGGHVTASSTVEVPPRWAAKNLVDGRTAFHPPIRYGPPEQDGIFAGSSRETASPWIEFDLGKPLPLDQIRLHPVHSRLGGEVPGFLFPRHLRIQTSLTPDYENSKVLFDSGDYLNPGNNPMSFKARKTLARYVRITAVKCEGNINRFGLSEVEIYANNTNVAPGSQIARTPDSQLHWSYSWPVTNLTDGFTSYGPLLELPKWLHGWERRQALEAELQSVQRHEAALTSQAQRRAGTLGGALSVSFLLGVGILVARSRWKRQRDLEDLRMRLARDIHDDIGSNLAGIVVLSEVAGAASPEENAQNVEDWREVNRIAQETMDAMREVLWLVGGRARADLDLMKHLKLAANRMLAGRDVCWSRATDHFPGDLSGETKRHMFLFFKEALNNVARHSGATRVELAATVDDHKAVLTVRDNGCGFNPRKARQGIGMISQRMRAREVRGTFNLLSAPGQGATVELEVPLQFNKSWSSPRQENL